MTTNRTPSRDTLVRSLSRLVGAENVLSREEARSRFSHDQYWYAIAAAAAGRAISRPAAAVRPQTAEQVALLLRFANKSSVPVTPWGGGSGVQGAANADRGGIVLDLSRLSRVRLLDKKSLVCVVEAGKVCRDFETNLNAQGLSFTHYPASTEWATIGGCIAARGSGVLSTKYGKIEDHVLSLEFATPTGELVCTPCVPRHAAGPELTQLLVGAEGTLGVITAATVKLRSLPRQKVFGAFSFRDLGNGIEAGRRIMISGVRPAVMRLYDQHAASHSLARAVEMELADPTLVLMFDGDIPDLVKLEAEKGFELCRSLGGTELPPRLAETWWNRRYVFYYPPYAPELPSIWGTVDVVSDFSHLEDVYRAVTEAIRTAVSSKWNLQLTTHFSHWYEWGSMIYARMKIPQGPASLKQAKVLHDRIFKKGVEAALRAGAVMNDHHGVGLRLAPYMKAQYGETFKTLRRIKRAMDPNGILCPGKLNL